MARIEVHSESKLLDVSRFQLSKCPSRLNEGISRRFTKNSTSMQSVELRILFDESVAAQDYGSE